MGFTVPNGKVIDEIYVDSGPGASGGGKVVSFQYRYAVHDKNIKLTASPSIEIQNVKTNAVAKLITFKVKFLKTNINRVLYVIASMDTVVFGINTTSEDTLRIVYGEVKQHEGFESDVFAGAIGKSENSNILNVYYRVLSAKNNVELPTRSDWNQLDENPLKQNTGTDARKWNCGGALMTFASTTVGGSHSLTGGTLYYKRPTANAKLDDLVFDTGKVRDGVARIRRKLKEGNVVTVFVGHNQNITIKDGEVQQSSNTHYLTIFGASKDGKQFLTFDPWPMGSIFVYKSGVAGDVKSIFMGLLEYDEASGKIKSKSGGQGSGKTYVVLKGL